MSGNGTHPLLDIRDLTVHFRLRKGFGKGAVAIAHAVDQVSLTLDAGETLALVGESGSGKTTVARAILGLVAPTSGEVVFDGVDLTSMGRRRKGAARSDIQIVFQDPYSSLSPRMTVRDVVAEPLRAHGRTEGLNARVLELLETVGMGTQHLWRRPHEFSGGQCQRIAIARALALDPRLVVLDEPTSALDVSVQARILVLLDELQERLGLAYLFIAHDLAVVEAVADTVAVMYLGQIVERGPARVVFRDPRHPYTAALLASVPSPDPRERAHLGLLEGDVPSPVDPPSGCRFHPRCRYRMPRCNEAMPELKALDGTGRVAACFLESPTTVQAAPGEKDQA